MNFDELLIFEMMIQSSFGFPFLMPYLSKALDESPLSLHKNYIRSKN